MTLVQVFFPFLNFSQNFETFSLDTSDDAGAGMWRLTQNVPLSPHWCEPNIGREWAEDRAPGTEWVTLGRDKSHG